MPTVRVWISFAGTPACFSAATTFAISFALASLAALPVWPKFSTPTWKKASSGRTSDSPVALTDSSVSSWSTPRGS